MRRWLGLALLCLIPVGASAQGLVVGNTLMFDPTMVMLANGKGHGKGHGHGPSRGASAPAPSPAPSPAGPAPSFGSEGRAESGFTYQAPPQYRVQGDVGAPSTQWPASPPLTIELPPLTVQPQASAGCCATLTIPVQVLYRQPLAQAEQLPAPQRRLAPSNPCPTGCVVEPLAPQAQPQSRQSQPPMVCNSAGQCIPWP